MAAQVTALGLRNGDPAVLRALLERRGSAVLAYCERLCAPGAAVDAASDAFARFRAIVMEATRPTDIDPESALLASTRYAAAARAPRAAQPTGPGGLGRLLGGRTTDQLATVPDLLVARAEGLLDAASEEHLNRLLDGSAAARAAEERFHAAEHAYRTAVARPVPAAVAEQVLGAMIAVGPAPAPPPPVPPGDEALGDTVEWAAPEVAAALDAHPQASGGPAAPTADAPQDVQDQRLEDLLVAEASAAGFERAEGRPPSAPVADLGEAPQDVAPAEPSAAEPAEPERDRAAAPSSVEDAGASQPPLDPPEEHPVGDVAAPVLAGQRALGDEEARAAGRARDEAEWAPETGDEEERAPETHEDTGPETAESEEPDVREDEPPAVDEEEEARVAVDATREWSTPREDDGAENLELEVAAARLDDERRSPDAVEDQPLGEPVGAAAPGAPEDDLDDAAEHLQSASGAVDEALADDEQPSGTVRRPAAAKLPAASPAPATPKARTLPRLPGERPTMPGRSALAPAAAVVVIATLGAMVASGVFGGNDASPPLDTGIVQPRALSSVPDGEAASVVADLRGAADRARQQRLADKRLTAPPPSTATTTGASAGSGAGTSDGSATTPSTTP